VNLLVISKGGKGEQAFEHGFWSKLQVSIVPGTILVPTVAFFSTSSVQTAKYRASRMSSRRPKQKSPPAKQEGLKNFGLQIADWGLKDHPFFQAFSIRNPNSAFEWWRRRESNPRPETFSKEHLRA